MKRNLMFLAAAFLGGLFSIGLYHFVLDSDKQIGQLPVTIPAQFSNYYPLPADGSLDFTLAAEKTVNSVVHVKTQVQTQPVYNPWNDFFGYQQSPEVQMGSGSGVIISSDGYIITNNHVVEGADKLQVTLNNNKNYDAVVVGTDPSSDIAVLKVDATNLPFCTWGSSDNVRIGQWVLAVGNPFDLTSTVTAGIVSAKARNINLLNPGYSETIFPVESFIQTDAAVNPGNSGGALVNTVGELIGINTAIASRTGSYAGYSFAVPATIAQKVASDIIKYGTVQRAFIGVKINDVTEEIAKEYGLAEISGVFVNELTAGGAASSAGIEPGDIILKVDNIAIKTVPELQEQVSKHRPGEKVIVSLWRDGKIETATVTLRNQEGGTEIETASTASTPGANSLGAQLAAVTEQEKKALGISGGAKVANILPGKLRDSGVQKGFIITEIGDEKVNTPEDVQKILSRKSGGVLLEGFYPNGTKAYYGFGM